MWKTVQLFYYADDRHDLIADGIRPIVERLGRQGAFDRFWLSTHWKRGPHLDLHIKTDAARFEDQVAPVLLPHLERYLQERPSTFQIEEEAAAILHAQIADLEYEEGPFVPFVPDNTIAVTPYTVRPRFWGGARAAEMAASFFAEATPMLFELAHELRADDQKRLQWSMGLMIGTVAAVGDLKGTHLCFRSHSQGFLSGQDLDGQVRAAMNGWYLANETWLSDCLQRWCDMATGKRLPDIRLLRYMELVAEYHARFEQGFVAGEITPFDLKDLYELQEARAPGSTAQWFERVSTYHSFMQKYPGSQEFADSAWFQAFRYIVNLTYHVVATLGTVALEKYFLCYAIARFMERYYGQKWWEMVAEKQGLPPGVTAEEMRDAY